jgi:hypothetical protein
MSSTGIMKSTGAFVERRKRKGFVQRTTEEGPPNGGLPTKGPRERLEDNPDHTRRFHGGRLCCSGQVYGFHLILSSSLYLLLAPSCQSEPELHIHLSIIPLH